MKRNVQLPLLVLSLAVWLALPTVALAATVEGGIDLWQTRAHGSTFADFSRFPIPAGFFCSRSEAFTGKIALRGAPIVTGIAGELGDTDTIVERLDRATFDKSGTAVTRIQVRALQLESLAPLATACGEFNLRVTLNGNQPVTRMRIVQEAADGGSFSAPLQMNIKLTFLPVAGKSARGLELVRNNFQLAADPKAPWSINTGKRGFSHPGLVYVDTDGDQRPDTLLPGTTSFAAGLRRGLDKIICDVTCHTGTDGDHCVYQGPPPGTQCP